MQEKITQFYLDREEPLRSVLLAIHDYVLAAAPDMRVAWKWNTPFFVYKKKNLCYLNVERKTGRPYLGFMNGDQLEHPLLQAEGRKRIKILAFDAEADLPVEALEEVLAAAIDLLEGGE